MIPLRTRISAAGLQVFLGIVFLTLTSVAFAAPSERIRASDLHRPADGMQGEMEFQKDIQVTKDIKMPVRIEVTAKGNGSLRVGNLELKVYDDHNDGIYYEGGLLDIDFCDLDGDGKRAMIISGII